MNMDRLAALLKSIDGMVQMETHQEGYIVGVIVIGKGYVAHEYDEDLEQAVNAALDKLEAS